MVFKPEEHLRSLKGQQYLDVKFRLMWLREEHPEASIKTEMTHLDTEIKLAVFRADISIPNMGSATGYGSETERDFPQGWVEKAETKAVGRALAHLGYGTQFALDLGDTETSNAASKGPEAGMGTAQLQSILVGLLAKDADAGGKIPKLVEDMTEVELTKTISWLRNRATTRG